MKRNKRRSPKLECNECGAHFQGHSTLPKCPSCGSLDYRFRPPSNASADRPRVRGMGSVPRHTHGWQWRIKHEHRGRKLTPEEAKRYDGLREAVERDFPPASKGDADYDPTCDPMV